VGNRQYEHRDSNLGNDDFGYDLNSQLTGFTRSATLTTNTTSAFTFDAAGNRSRLVKDAVTTNYTINNLNEYATVTGVAAPTYDNNGNLLTYDDGTGTATFFYDSMNRLTQAVKGGTTEKFYYDGLNRQVARSVTGGASVITVWDGWNVYAEFAPGGTTRTDLLVYGPEGDLVKSTALGQFFYPDALGSTAHYADANGTLKESYTYDHYGTPVVYDPAGNQRTGGTMYGITRLFTGQQWHDATKIYDLRNRFMSPTLGRFLQPDPIGFSGDPANLYRYCGNNPGNRIDSFGLNPLDDAIANLEDQGGHAELKRHHWERNNSPFIKNGYINGYEVLQTYLNALAEEEANEYFRAALPGMVKEAVGALNDSNVPIEPDWQTPEVGGEYYDQNGNKVSPTSPDDIHDSAYDQVNAPPGAMMGYTYLADGQDAPQRTSRYGPDYVGGVDGAGGTWGTPYVGDTPFGNPIYQPGTALAQYVPYRPPPKKKPH
jgi:RHS repeat-associated protein